LSAGTYLAEVRRKKDKHGMNATTTLCTLPRYQRELVLRIYRLTYKECAATWGSMKTSQAILACTKSLRPRNTLLNQHLCLYSIRRAIERGVFTEKACFAANLIDDFVVTAKMKNDRPGRGMAAAVWNTLGSFARFSNVQEQQKISELYYPRSRSCS